MNANKQDAGGLPRENCPFCGSHDISDGEALTEKPDGTRVTQSQCLGCGAFGPEAVVDGPDYGDALAIAAWNRRNGEQCRAASGEPVAWIRPDGVTTSDAGLMRHWEAQGLQFEPLVRALSRGVPEGK